MAYTTGSSGQMTSDGFTMNYGKEYQSPHSSPKGSGLWSGEYADRKGYGHGARVAAMPERVCIA